MIEIILYFINSFETLAQDSTKGPDTLYQITYNLLRCELKLSEFNVYVPLVMKEPVRLRAESLLEVESQRSRGSDSSGKKPLVRSSGECSTTNPCASRGLWLGMVPWLTFTDIINWFRSNCSGTKIAFKLNKAS